MSKHVFEYFCSPFDWYKMVIGKVIYYTFDHFPILHRSGYPFGKLTFIFVSTKWTCFDLCLVFRYFDSERWQIKNLTLFNFFNTNTLQRILANVTVIYRMHLYFIDIVRLG